MNNQLRDLDALALFSGFLGVLNYTENIKQTSNDEIIQEIKKETNERIDLVIEQNKEIIEQNKKIMEVIERGYKQT